MRWFITLLFISILCTVKSQNLAILYEESSVTTMQMSINGSVETQTHVMKNKMLLHYSNGASLYEAPPENEEDASPIMVSGMNIQFKKPDNKIYKDFNAGQLIAASPIADRDFLIEDTLPVFNWQLIHNEDTVINGYNCKKAIADSTVVWYCPDIPVNDGPENYWGLPGLILQTQQDTRTITALKIETSPEAVVAKPDKGKEVSQKEYDELAAKKMKELGVSPGQKGMKIQVEISNE